MQKALKQESKIWWFYLILGILFTALGVVMFANLSVAITTVQIITGIFFLVSGLGGAITCIVDRKFISWWGLHLVCNIFIFIAGIFMFTQPAFAASFIWIICGFGFFFDGLLLIVLAIQLKDLLIGSWIWMLMVGILILLASFSIMSNPIIGLSVVGIMTAISAIFIGIENIGFAINLKQLLK